MPPIGDPIPDPIPQVIGDPIPELAPFPIGDPIPEPIGPTVNSSGADEPEGESVDDDLGDFLGIKKPSPLKPLHPESSLDDASLNYWRGRSTAEIIASLSPGSPEALRVKVDGTIMNGNTRVTVLKERGVDVDRLPREPYP
jgi:hypothetical protein